MKLVIYLFKKVIPLFLGAMFFFALVLNLVDLFMNIATYLQNNCSGKEIMLVMAYYIPKTIWYAVPVAILFSTSYALSEMYAANEIQALLASGVSLRSSFRHPTQPWWGLRMPSAPAGDDGWSRKADREYPPLATRACC